MVKQSDDLNIEIIMMNPLSGKESFRHGILPLWNHLNTRGLNPLSGKESFRLFRIYGFGKYFSKCLNPLSGKESFRPGENGSFKEGEMES